MALSVEIAVFWNVMPCRLVCRCSCLWAICCLHLQDEDRDKFLRNVVACQTTLCHVSLDSNSYIPELSVSHRIVIVIHGHHLTAGVHRFSKILESFQNFKRQEGDMKQFPCWGSTNIRRHGTKFSHHGDRAPGVFAPSSYCEFLPCQLLR